MYIIRVCKRLIIVSVVLLLFTQITVSAYFRHEKEADVFFNMGVYKGVSVSYFEPNLGAFLDRETAFVFLLRLVADQHEIAEMKSSQINSYLSKYADSYLVSDWAKRYIAYAIKHDIINGNTDYTLTPKKIIDGRSFCTLLLNFLDYEIDGDNWAISTFTLSKYSEITIFEAQMLNDKMLIKDDMIGIVWKSLLTENADGDTLLELIMKNNNLSRTQMQSLGFRINNNDISVPHFSLTQVEIDMKKYSYSNPAQSYEGEKYWGLPHGYGSLNYPNGSRYEGQFANGVRQGEGFLIFEDNSYYKGSWWGDMMEGYGTLTWFRGDVYQGNFHLGLFSGQGTLTWANGDFYMGQWNENVFSGYGTFHWVNGDVYEGNWENGMKNGYGVFRWSSGDIYEGQWVDGLQHGQGKMSIFVDGQYVIKEGLWEYGNFIG